MRKVVGHVDGWEYDDVSMQKVGWDIISSRGAEERHVEVKGVSGRHPAVLLTRNEIDKAGSCRSGLTQRRVVLATVE